MLKLTNLSRSSVLKIIYFILAVMTAFSAGAYPYDKTLMFYKGGVIAIDQPGVNIAKIYGIKLSPLNATVNGRENETFIHHRVENLGNATNSIRFEVKCLSRENAWSAQLVRDDNADGVKQFWEYDSLSSVQDIGEGAVLSFFVIIKTPENAKAGDSGRGGRIGQR